VAFQLEDHLVLVKGFGCGMGVGRFYLGVDMGLRGAMSMLVGVDRVGVD
jgi:hypothetical protein